MYTHILYTLCTPQQGQCLTGLTQDRMHLHVTCPLTSVELVEKHGSRAIYRCVTRHNTPYLIYVLPPEADLRTPELPYLHALHRLDSRLPAETSRAECSCQPENKQESGPARENDHLRSLLWWLGFLSVILGSQSLFGEKLWELFLEVVRLLLKP